MFSYLSIKQPARVCLIGLDASGKTLILYKLKLGEIVPTMPTVGINVETLSRDNIEFSVWDFKGGCTGTARQSCRYYYENSDAFIFVVDSNDRDRIAMAKEELDYVLNTNSLREAPILFFANKQDLPSAMSVAEIIKRMELTHIKNRRWFIEATSAVSGIGLHEGLDWLSNIVNARRWSKSYEDFLKSTSAYTMSTETSIVSIETESTNAAADCSDGDCGWMDHIINFFTKLPTHSEVMRVF